MYIKRSDTVNLSFKIKISDIFLCPHQNDKIYITIKEEIGANSPIVLQKSYPENISFDKEKLSFTTKFTQEESALLTKDTYYCDVKIYLKDNDFYVSSDNIELIHVYGTVNGVVS